MELLVKKTIKILSFQEDNSLELTQILPALKPLINNVSQDKFVQKLKENKNIKVDESKKDKILISLNREKAKQSNDEKQLNLFFIEDKTNKSLYYLYRLVLKAGPAGINYSDLASQFNAHFFKEGASQSKGGQKNGGEKSNKKNGKKGDKESQQNEEFDKDIKKLDITNVSHYCRKLFTLKFINILPEKICKKAVATKFQDKSLQIDTKIKRKQNMASQIKAEIDLDDKKQQFTKLSIVSDPWKYLKEDTFILNELTFNQNILLNFASYEAYLREGLLQTEIASKINKLGERKMLVRSLDNIKDDYEVLSTADRQGRTFSLKFHIKSQVMAEYIDQLLKENKINIKKELEDMLRQQPQPQQMSIQNEGSEQSQQKNSNSNQVQSKLQFSNAGQPKENRFLEIKIEEKQNQNEVISDNLESKTQLSLNQDNKQNSDDKINQSIPQINQRQELFNQNPKLNYSSFEHIYKYFQDNQKLIQDLMLVDEEFVKKYMKIPPSFNDKDYQKFSELLLKIINETVEFTYVRTKKGLEGGIQNDQPNSNSKQQKTSKKQISRNKLNRYIHILNRIEEKKVIKNLNLKKYIIALEKNQGVGEIDKKTLEHILNTFQFINYITVKKIKIDIQTISQNIVRSITIHKDIPEDDLRVIKAEKTISKGLLKKGPKQDDSNCSDSSSESDYLNSQYSQSQMSKSSGISKLQITKSNGQQGKINSAKQSDITNFLIKKQRNLQPNQKIYYYDEDENENQESNSMQIEQSNNKQNANSSTQANPQRKTSMQMQLQEALSKVTKENCEIPAGPEKMKILASLIFQFMEKKLKKNYEDSFKKINEINYSTIYTNFYFQKDQVEFKYPLFQQNLCNNLLQLSQSHKKYPDMMDLELDTLDINTVNVPTVDQLIDEAFSSSQDSATQNPTQDIFIPAKPKQISLQEAQDLLEKNNQNKKDIEKLYMSLSALKGKDTKNQKNLIQDALLKFKSYLIRYPCRKLIDTKLRYQMVDYFSFLNQCVQSDSIKFFKLNKENQFYEKIKLSEISLENIDCVFYQITNNYYNHFNLFQQQSSAQSQ